MGYHKTYTSVNIFLKTLVILPVICGLFKKYQTWFFPAETNEAWEVRCGGKVEGTFMRMRGFFPASRQRQSHAASV